MSEKFTSFEHVIGKGLTPEDKAKILKEKERMFKEQNFKNLADVELKKTNEEIEIIDLINQETNKHLRNLGLKEFNIPAKNINILNKEGYEKIIGKKFTAIYSPAYQAISINELDRNSRTVFASKVLHEMIHFKSYGSIQKQENEEPEVYRTGLSIISQSGKKQYFDNLNEGLTEELAKHIMLSFKNNPLFKDEIEKTRKHIKEFDMGSTKDEKGNPIFDIENIYFIDVKEVKDKEVKWITYSFAREKEREILNSLIDKLFEKNKDKFQNRDEVFNVFIKAMLSGNIIPLGRLVDGTFGRKTFSKISELDANIDKLEEFVGEL